MLKKLLIISTTAIILSLCLTLIVKTNITQARFESEEGCSPLLPNTKGWARGSTVYFDVSGIPAGKPRDNVVKAFERWNTANASNGSGVNFQPSSSQNPATFTVNVGNAGGNPARVATNTSGGTVTSADAEINLNDTTIFDKSVLGYSDAILKAMLHEIGHTMGLDDMPIPNTGPTANCGGQSSGQSVMNSYCGTNDSGSNMPTNVKDCDNRSVRNNPQYQPTPTPTPVPSPTPGGGGECLTDLTCEECPCNNCATGCEPPEPTCELQDAPIECNEVCEIDEYGDPVNCEMECSQGPPVWVCY